MPKFRILGIDPGSLRTGFGVIEIDSGRARYVACGIIKIASKPFPERLGIIYRGISEVIAEHQPNAVAIEEVFFATNPRSALKLGQARGAAVTAAVMAELPVFEYAPRLVKQAVVGTGAADKAQVQFMISRLLRLSAAPGEDAADALAIALCHFNHKGIST